MVVGSTAWNESQLARRRLARVFPDRECYVASPEDTILGKLVYYREGGSEKHVRDITGILTVGLVTIDRGYLEHHAAKLGVTNEWQSILDKLGIA
jgi:hypothetical protein